MNVQAITRYARISPFKVREVTRLIQGLPATDALDLLRFAPKKAAFLVRKTLQSAIANAENNNNLRVEHLTVLSAVAGEGPTIKRFMPRARGSASPIRKRTSHIQIIVTDELPIPEKRQRGTSKKSTRRKPAAQAPAAAPSGAADSTPATPAAPATEEPTPATPAAPSPAPAPEPTTPPAASSSTTESGTPEKI